MEGELPYEYYWSDWRDCQRKIHGFLFFRQKGAAVLDADRIARELSEPGGKLHAEYVHHFGAEVLQSDGTLNRRRIGQIVFPIPSRNNGWMRYLIRLSGQNFCESLNRSETRSSV